MSGSGKLTVEGVGTSLACPAFGTNAMNQWKALVVWIQRSGARQWKADSGKRRDKPRLSGIRYECNLPWANMRAGQIRTSRARPCGKHGRHCTRKGRRLDGPPIWYSPKSCHSEEPVTKNLSADRSPASRNCCCRCRNECRRQAIRN